MHAGAKTTTASLKADGTATVSDASSADPAAIPEMRLQLPAIHVQDLFTANQLRGVNIYRPEDVTRIGPLGAGGMGEVRPLLCSLRVEAQTVSTSTRLGAWNPRSNLPSCPSCFCQ
jgi:hypothetical protein